MTIRSTLRSQQLHRQLQKELKLAEFRLKWIEDLRSDFSHLVGCIYRLLTKGQILAKDDASIFARVLMQLNPEDAEHKKLRKLVKKVLLKDTETECFPAAELMSLGKKILRKEWRRLSSALEKIKRYDTSGSST